jgi:hypothetical protein
MGALPFPDKPKVTPAGRPMVDGYPRVVRRHMEHLHAAHLLPVQFKGRWNRPKMSVSAYKFGAQLFFLRARV